MRAPGSPPSALHGRIVTGAFRPHPLLRNPHLQTVFPALLRPVPRLDLRIERWELPDGDFLDLGWHGTGPGPRVILLHGLTGGFDSKYARGLARQLGEKGWRTVILQARGAGPEPNRKPYSYHHGHTADLRALAQRLHAESPETPLYAVGWSLGANVLLKYLGESGDETPLAGAAAVCAPFDLHRCAVHLSQGVARLYQNDLLRGLKQTLRNKHRRIPLPIDIGRALAARDFIEFDDYATAPLNGFSDAADYYVRSASGQFLRHIQRPTLVIHAKDDPFMVPDIIPDEGQLSPQVTLELCDFGGHVGFVTAGRRLKPEYWLERRIPDYLDSLSGT
jgi:uncharacterized protein